MLVGASVGQPCRPAGRTEVRRFDQSSCGTAQYPCGCARRHGHGQIQIPVQAQSFGCWRSAASATESAVVDQCWSHSTEHRRRWSWSACRRPLSPGCNCTPASAAYSRSMAAPTGVPTLSPPATAGGGFPGTGGAAQQQVTGDDQQVALSTTDDPPGPGEAHVYRVSASQAGAVFGGYTVVILG